MSSFRPGGYSSSEDEFSDGFDFSSHDKPIPSIETTLQVVPDPVNQLKHAIVQGNVKEVQRILTEENLLVDTPLQAGWSALMYGSANGHANIVSFLLEHGADPNYNKDNYTALMAACSVKDQEERALECVKLLLDKGADCKARDSYRTTSLMFACKESHIRIVKLLLPRSDINATDNQGWSALFWAVYKNNADIVELLINSGATFDFLDQRRRLPLDIAEAIGSDRLICLLGGEVEEPEIGTESCDMNTRKSFLDLYEEANSDLHSLKKEVFSFLSSLHLEQFIPYFENNNIDLISLLTISEEKLKEIGIVATRHRRKILQAIKTFHLEPWKKSSVVIKPRDEVFTVHDGVVALCGTMRQLDLLQASIIYVRQKLSEPIQNVQNEEDAAEIEKLKQSIKGALLYSELLHRESNYLLCQVKKIEESDKIVPADLIVEKKEKFLSYKMKTLMTVAVIISVACLKFLH